MVYTNHFPVTMRKRAELHTYKVTISPEFTSASLRRKIFKKLLEENPKLQFMTDIVNTFDGEHDAILWYSCLDRDIKKSMNGQIVDENGWVRNYNVTLEHLGITNLRDLLTGDKQKQGVLYTLDFMFQEAFKRQSDLKGYDTYGWRAFYNFQLGRGELGHGVEYFRGFSQSLRPTQMGLSLNLIDKATAFYKPICVLDFISELLDGRSLDRPFSADERTKVDDALENVLVETHLEKSAYKRYKFDKLTPEGTTQLTTRGKQKTGLFEYYKEKHKCTLLYPHLPSILVKIRSEKIHRHTCPLRFVGSPRSKDTRSVLIRFRCLVWEISLRRGRRISSIISYKP